MQRFKKILCVNLVVLLLMLGASAAIACPSTATIGYWKNHVTDNDICNTQVRGQGDLYLGYLCEGKGILVTSATQAQEIFRLGDSSNGIEKLYAQFLATKLNWGMGTDIVPYQEIVDAWLAADLFLATHNAGDWANLTEEEKQQVLAWKDIFDQYNNGEIGPGARE